MNHVALARTMNQFMISNTTEITKTTPNFTKAEVVHIESLFKKYGIKKLKPTTASPFLRFVKNSD